MACPAKTGSTTPQCRVSSASAAIFSGRRRWRFCFSRENRVKAPKRKFCCRCSKKGGTSEMGIETNRFGLPGQGGLVLERHSRVSNRHPHRLFHLSRENAAGDGG